MRKIRCKNPRFRLDANSYGELHRQVLVRDGWRCQACGCMQSLQVHHSPDLVEPIGVIEDAGFRAFRYSVVLRLGEEVRPTLSEVPPSFLVMPDIGELLQRREELRAFALPSSGVTRQRANIMYGSVRQRTELRSGRSELVLCVKPKFIQM